MAWYRGMEASKRHLSDARDRLEDERVKESWSRKVSRESIERGRETFEWPIFGCNLELLDGRSAIETSFQGWSRRDMIPLDKLWPVYNDTWRVIEEDAFAGIEELRILREAKDLFRLFNLYFCFWVVFQWDSYLFPFSFFSISVGTRVDDCCSEMSLVII